MIKDIKPWEELTPEERQARAEAVRQRVRRQERVRKEAPFRRSMRQIRQDIAACKHPLTGIVVDADAESHGMAVEGGARRVCLSACRRTLEVLG